MSRSSRRYAAQAPTGAGTGERNFLLHPGHPDFARIVIGTPEPLETDLRLMRNFTDKGPSD